MLHRIRRCADFRHFGKATKVAAAALFAVVGLLVGSTLQWTPASVAQSMGQGPPLSAGIRPAPTSFADLVERLGPAVVNIQVTKVAPAEDLSRMPRPEWHRLQGSGSGVIISQDGYILTNNHVVERAQEVTVTTADQQMHQAQVVGRDPKMDLAVLRIEAKAALPVAAMGNSTDLKVGDWVVAIGNPFGLGHTVTAGIVSAKGRVIGAGPYDDFIQTDAPINPGNSGGPLFNTQGEMVGITTAIVASGQGIGFAIPIDLAKPLIPQLVSTGEVTRGYLGVSVQGITPELARTLKLQERQGALVADVVVGGPAATAGIHRGDVIIGFNGATVHEAHDLPALVARAPIGERAAVTLRRDGQTQQIPVTIGKLPSEKRAVEESSSSPRS
jgi:serine protease Do